MNISNLINNNMQNLHIVKNYTNSKHNINDDFIRLMIIKYNIQN